MNRKDMGLVYNVTNKEGKVIGQLLVKDLRLQSPDQTAEFFRSEFADHLEVLKGNKPPKGEEETINPLVPQQMRFFLDEDNDLVYFYYPDAKPYTPDFSESKIPTAEEREEIKSFVELADNISESTDNRCNAVAVPINMIECEDYIYFLDICSKYKMTYNFNEGIFKRKKQATTETETEKEKETETERKNAIGIGDIGLRWWFIRGDNRNKNVDISKLKPKLIPEEEKGVSLVKYWTSDHFIAMARERLGQEPTTEKREEAILILKYAVSKFKFSETADARLHAELYSQIHEMYQARENESRAQIADTILKGQPSSSSSRR